MGWGGALPGISDAPGDLGTGLRGGGEADRGHFPPVLSSLGPENQGSGLVWLNLIFVPAQ